jgi:glycosyltransferase involved in cell wall biosynthesis
VRIVVDMQGAQTESRKRGIGRHTLGIAAALARHPGGHEIWLALNARWPNALAPMRAALAGLVPDERFRVFDAPPPFAEHEARNALRTRAAELKREAFLGALAPEIVYVPSLFEGWGGDAACSVGRFGDQPTAVVLHDLIPWLHPDQYFSDRRHGRYYARKLESLRRADLVLAVSTYVRRDAVELLGLAPERVRVVHNGVDERFRPPALDEAARRELLRRHGLRGPFVLFVGAFEPRKNLDGLVRAFALLPEPLRRSHQLLAVGPTAPPALGDELRRLDLADAVVFGGTVTDDDLVALYGACAAFVLPSFDEGFGLPALEAMACGAAVIGANATSIPEVIGRADALFDPARPEAIAAKLADALNDGDFRQSLCDHGLARASQFSWDAAAKATLAAFEEIVARRRCRQAALR